MGSVVGYPTLIVTSSPGWHLFLPLRPTVLPVDPFHDPPSPVSSGSVSLPRPGLSSPLHLDRDGPLSDTDPPGTSEHVLVADALPVDFRPRVAHGGSPHLVVSSSVHGVR